MATGKSRARPKNVGTVRCEHNPVDSSGSNDRPRNDDRYRYWRTQSQQVTQKTSIGTQDVAPTVSGPAGWLLES